MFAPGEIINYIQMCSLELTSLQRGMNYRLPTGRTVVLMSRRPDAPYSDEVTDEGRTIIYEGHDEPQSERCPVPKIVDQPLYSPGGSLTQNGIFMKAAADFKSGKRDAEQVHIYEKLKKGIWVYNGTFALVDGTKQAQDNRSVFKFRLELLEVAKSPGLQAKVIDEFEHPRMIPSSVKQEVFKRDKGMCVECGAKDELHFDHVVPYSKGGSSLLASNIQLLCARHNMSKGASFKF